METPDIGATPAENLRTKTPRTASSRKTLKLKKSIKETATPKSVVKRLGKNPKSDKKSSKKSDPKNLSHIETYKRMPVRSPFIVPLTPQNKLSNNVKATPKNVKHKWASFHATPSKEFLSQSLSLPGTPSSFDATDFKFDAVQTPSIPVEMLVSPMSAKSASKSRKSTGLATPKSPKNDMSDVKGVKKLMKTPKAPKTPKNDLTDLSGVKKLMKTPGAQPKSPKNDLSDVGGVKKLMKTPKAPKTPKNDLTDVSLLTVVPIRLRSLE